MLRPYVAFMLHEKPIVPPPWTLRGDTFAFLDRDATGKIGLRAFIRYDHSPVGAYNEMAFAVWTRRGVRVLEMPVTLETSMIGGRANWGFPKTLEDIEYSISEKSRVSVGFRGRKIVARLSRWSFPLFAKAWTVQTLNGDVRVPLEIGGRARFCFVGKRLGVHLEDFTLTVFTPEKM